MRVDRMESGLYSVVDKTNKIILANVNRRRAVAYMAKLKVRNNNKKGKK